MAVETKTFTAEDLLRIPEDGFVYELVDGELRKMSPAGFEHGRIAMLVGASLAAHVKEKRLGTVTAAETGYLIRRNPDTVRAPDAAFVRRERLVAAKGFFPGPPDLVVEVLSPGDTYSEVDAKVVDWLVAGVRLVILIDPSQRSASIHRSLTEVTRLTIEDLLEGADVVPGWRLPLADIFEA